jgi:hypothetical protein
LLRASGEAHLSGHGKLHGVALPPFDSSNIPVELSPADHATQSWQRIPDGVCFLDIDNGWAQIHVEGQPLSDDFRRYFTVFKEFCRKHTPGGLVGFVLWWDGRCDDMSPFETRVLPNVDELLAQTPELRVFTLAPT